MSKANSYSNETIFLIGSGSFFSVSEKAKKEDRPFALFFAFTEHYLPSDLFIK